MARVRGGRQSGAGTVEYVGMVIAVAVLIVGLAAVFPSVGDQVTCRLSQAVASITGGSATCSSSAPDDRADGQETEGDGDREELPPNPEPAPLADVPKGLDPDSDLVKAMQSTERGREALQWLADNNIKIVINSAKNGAWWDGSKIVMGNGYDDPAVLIHEVNHAKSTKEGRKPDIGKFTREDYVNGMIAEETEGVVQQIQAAQEFRRAGHTVPTQPGETVYNNAYQNAKANGASEAEARQAARDAIEQQFRNGNFRTSNTNEPYLDYYGNAWDRRHPCVFGFLFCGN
jgi:hypothetical protein